MTFPRIMVPLAAAKLTAGADAGAFSVPGVVAQAIRGERDLTAALVGLKGPDVSSERAALAADLAAAALSGQEWPAYDRIEQAEARAAAVAIHREALVAAVDAGRGSLRRLLRSQAEVLIVDNLRPALARLLKTAAKHAPAIAGLPVTEEVAGALEPATRTAYVEMRAAAAKYALLRDAFTTLRAEAKLHPVRDTSGRFEEISNLPDVWPTRRQWRDETPPWPTSPPLRLAHLLTSGALLWLPLPGEQDAVFEEHARAVEAERRSRMAGAPGR